MFPWRKKKYFGEAHPWPAHPHPSSFTQWECEQPCMICNRSSTRKICQCDTPAPYFQCHFCLKANQAGNLYDPILQHCRLRKRPSRPGKAGWSRFKLWFDSLPCCLEKIFFCRWSLGMRSMTGLKKITCSKRVYCKPDKGAVHPEIQLLLQHCCSEKQPWSSEAVQQVRSTQMQTATSGCLGLRSLHLKEGIQSSSSTIISILSAITVQGSHPQFYCPTFYKSWKVKPPKRSP